MIIKPTCITSELLEMCRPCSDDTGHWAMNLNAVMECGYCEKCNLVPVGCAREGCGECKGQEDTKGYFAELRAKVADYDNGAESKKMNKLKNNLREISNFLTYFSDDFLYPLITSFEDYSVEVCWSDNENLIALTFLDNKLHYRFWGKSVESGEIDLTNMQERIKLVGEIKKHLK